jgi:hypothetical protein
MPAARVTSVEALRDAKTALAKFVHEVSTALGEVDVEAGRTIQWLRMEQVPFWKNQIIRRSELLARARSELLRKQLSSMQENPSCVDERKAVEKAKAALADADARLKRTKFWITELDREWTLYRGSITALQDLTQRDAPKGLARIEKLIRTLYAYAAVSLDPNAEHAKSSTTIEPPGDADAAAALLAAIVDHAKRLRPRVPTPDQRAAAPAVDRPWGAFSPTRAASTPAPAPQAPDAPTDAPAEAALSTPADASDTSPDASAVDAPAEQLSLLDRAGLSDALPPPDRRVVIAQGVFDGADPFMVRLPPASPADSGWYVGVSDEGSGAAAVPATIAALSIEQVLAARPDWRDLLALPEGTLAVLSPSGVELLLDSTDEVVWSP